MRAPLMNADMEAGVLGFCVVDVQFTGRLIAAHGLVPQDFAGNGHAEMWRAILAVHDRGHATDDLTVAAEMRHEHAEAVVARAVTHAARKYEIPGYVAEMKALALRRQWQHAGHLLLEAAEVGDEKLVAQAEATVAAPTITEDTSDGLELGDAVCRWMGDTSSDVAISTGFPKLDDNIGAGLRPGDLTAIGGWTNMGKSPLADGMLLRAALAGKRAHLYLNEMSKTDRSLRFISMLAGLSMTKMQRRNLNGEEYQRFLDAAGRIPVGMTDSGHWTAEQIARHIRANKWDIACLDVLHNMPYEGESELHRIVSTLANACRASGTHLILVCHLNDKRNDGTLLPRPTLRDVRGSAMIRNLCANVLLLHRPQDKLADGEIVTDTDGFVYADKARHGQPCTAQVQFRPRRMGFFPAGHLEEVA